MPYVLTTDGVCTADHGVASVTECNAAAAALSLGDHTATVVEWPFEPSRCFVLFTATTSSGSNPSQQDELYFNTAASTGVTCDATNACICVAPASRAAARPPCMLIVYVYSV